MHGGIGGAPPSEAHLLMREKFLHIWNRDTCNILNRPGSPAHKSAVSVCAPIPEAMQSGNSAFLVSTHFHVPLSGTRSKQNDHTVKIRFAALMSTQQTERSGQLSCAFSLALLALDNG